MPLFPQHNTYQPLFPRIKAYCICLLFAIILLCKQSVAQSTNHSLFNNINLEQLSSIYLHYALTEATDSEKELERIVKAPLESEHLIASMYSNTNYETVWCTSNKPNASFTKLIDFITLQASSYGLPAQLYSLNRLTILQEEVELAIAENNLPQAARAMMQLDILATETYIKLAVHLKHGFIKKENYQLEWKLDKINPFIIMNQLASIKAHRNLSLLLLSNQPQNITYNRLLRATKHYLSIHPQLDQFRPSVDYSNGKSNKFYEDVKQSLIYHKYLPTAYKNKKVAKETLHKIIITFQKDHGMTADGIIGQSTRSVLRMSTFDKYMQLAINLERERWEDRFASDFIYVNIPSYDLLIFNNYQLIEQYKSVLGKPSKETPEMTSHISYLVFNPSWYVPHSIASTELLSEIKADKYYFKNYGYQVLNKKGNKVDPSTINWKNINSNNFNYRLIQKSNDDNELGVVKIYFPNDEAIYIHDTPFKDLFEKVNRSFSHGCIRLQDPLQFVHYLTSYEDLAYSLDDIDSLVNEKKQQNKRITFEKKLPIYIRYKTAGGLANGTPIFYRDVYLKDAPLRSILDPLMEQSANTNQLKRLATNP